MALLHIGNTKESIDNAASGVIGVLKAGFDYHADQETVQAALSSLAKLGEVHNVSVTNSTFSTSASPAIAMGAGEDPEDDNDDDDDQSE